MMTRMATVLVACATLVIGATSQARAPEVIHTEFFIESGVESRGPRGFEVVAVGRLDSTKRRCVQRRRVKLYFKRNGERHLRDTGLSSRNGVVALTARARAAPDGYMMNVTKERIHGPRRPYTCWRAHDGRRPFNVAPPSPPPP
ncbi:MAG: hypothetical protein AABM66_03780 [Actinomycetota bacterium]